MKHLYHHIRSACHVCCCITAALFFLTACSNIDEADRLILVDTGVPVDTTVVETDSLWDAPVTVVPRRVLIEDHTGQHCPNCPDAVDVIHSLQGLYGNIIVPVAIHSKELGIMEPEGLGTELGNTYYSRWGIKAKPAGLISRIDGGDGVVMNVTIWPLAVEYIAALETPLDIRVKAMQNNDNPAEADIDIKIICTREGQSATGKLQVWVTEDDIIAPQDYLNGVHYAEYCHDHVLRAAVNGDWGEDVSVSGLGNQLEQHYVLKMKSSWKPENLAIVAFVYNEDEVLQVTRAKLKIK